MNTELNFKTIGNRIQQYRIERKMTQEELAEACELSPGYISQLEGPNSYFCPSLKTLFTIAEVLNISAAKLIDIDD